MAYTERLAPHVASHLAEGERLLAGVRANPKGCHAVNASLGGIGAALGFVIGTGLSDGYLGAALGGVLGAAAGVLIALLYAIIRVRRTTVIDAPNLALALTDRRMLIFARSALTNRPNRMSRAYPLEQIRTMAAGEPRLLFPPPFHIVLTNGTKLNLEVGRIDDPAGFAEAFAERRGG